MYFFFPLYIVTCNLVYDLIVFVRVIEWICPLEKRNFIDTHTKKDGTPMNDEAVEKIVTLFY
jgi:hypothetical protein